MPIRLLVLDIDGVLTDGEAMPLDLPLLAELAALNRAARKNRGSPQVTLCTGRPAPYVEIMLQAIDGSVPAVYENGAGLYVPTSYRFLPHPDLIHGGALQAVKQKLTDTLLPAGVAFFQPGKDHSLTVFPTDPGAIGPLSAQITEVLGSLATAVDIVPSVSCLNILPLGINKGRGLAYLSEFTGIPLEEMLGVGDSEVDLPFLSLVGNSAAPANAVDVVKNSVQYVSPQKTTDGLRDILQTFGVV